MSKKPSSLVKGILVIIVIIILIGSTGSLLLWTPMGKMTEVITNQTTTETTTEQPAIETTTEAPTIETTTTVVTIPMTTETTTSAEITPITTTTTTITTETTTTIPTETTTTVVEEKQILTVAEIKDGDTLILSNGEIVRLLEINTPEEGQKCYTEATNILKELVEGKEITLESDVTDRDQYDRLLRYIFVDSTFVNLKMVEEGYANTYIVEPNTKYAFEIRQAEERAKENKAGCLWEMSELPCADCIGIVYFHYNAEGNDCYNLNDEYVIFNNTCNFDCDLTGWIVKDETNHIYTFPSFILGGEKTVTLYTGCGTNVESELYWCNSGYACNAIWNNDGDTLYLRDASGNLIVSYGY